MRRLRATWRRYRAALAEGALFGVVWEVVDD